MRVVRPRQVPQRLQRLRAVRGGETVAAQAKRLGELSKLHDLALAAKQYLIGEHAAEREKRQALEVAVGQAQTVIVDLQALSTRESNEAEAYAVFERADAWLAKHRKPA